MRYFQTRYSIDYLAVNGAFSANVLFFYLEVLKYGGPEGRRRLLGLNPGIGALPAMGQAKKY